MCEKCGTLVGNLRKKHATLVERRRKVWKQAGVVGNMLLMIQSYLKGRMQRVVIDGTHSEWVLNEHGTPQGGVLSVCLFLIYSCCMLRDLDSLKSSFADDNVIWSDLPSEIDQINQLNLALRRLHEWSNKWRCDFAPNKCKIMRVCLRRTNKRPAKPAVECSMRCV